MFDNSHIEQSNTDSRPSAAIAVINFLPPYETRSSERKRQEQNFELILQPIYDYLPDYIPIEPYKIEARIPHRLYRQTSLQLSNTQKGIDPIDESTVYMTLIGKFQAKDILPESIEHTGYTICLSAPEDEFDIATNYLSSTYNTEIIGSPLRNRGLRHTEERDHENKIVTHTFFNGEAVHKIELRVKNELQTSILPIPKDKPKTPEENITAIPLRKTLFDSRDSGEFFIDDLPCTEDDNREKEKILKDFIETASLFLELGSFNLEYDKKKIYTNNNLKTFPNSQEIGPLVVFYTGEKQPHAGIKTFAGLVIARLIYAFNIDSMSIFASNRNQKDHFNQRFNAEFKNNMYETRDNVEIKVILEKGNNRPFRTQLIYEIENLGNNFDNVINIISEATEENPTKIDASKSQIKIYSNRRNSHMYIVSANKGRKE